MKRLFMPILLLRMLLCALHCQAQEADDPQPTAAGRQVSKLEILFRVNSSLIDTLNVANSRQFKELRDIIHNKDLDVTHIVVRTYTSPEGTITRNSILARNRGEAMMNYFYKSFPNIDPGIIESSSSIVGWSDIASDLRNDPNIPPRALAIMHSTSPDSDKEQLVKILDNGKTFNYLRTNVLHKYRYGYYHVSWHESAKEDVAPQIAPLLVDVVEEPVAEPVVEIPVIAPEPVAETVTDTVRPEPVVVPAIVIPKKELLLKTNALYLAATVFNVGVEYRLTPKLSIDLPFYYSPYSISDKFKLRVMGMQPELRYWLGETFREGHFVGVHAHVTGFNVAMGGDRYQDPEHALWGAGFSYGYFLPLRRNWNMEFTLGLGYANIRYDAFEAKGSKLYLRSGRNNYWGITRLGVSFGYMFNIESLWRR